MPTQDSIVLLYYTIIYQLFEEQMFEFVANQPRSIRRDEHTIMFMNIFLQALS